MSNDERADVEVSQPFFRRLPRLVLGSFHSMGLNLSKTFYSTKTLLARGLRWSAFRALQQAERLFLRNRTSRRGVQGGVKGSAITAGAIPGNSSRASAGAAKAMLEILETIDEAYETGHNEGRPWMYLYTPNECDD